jgi:hypothetical protein
MRNVVEAIDGNQIIELLETGNFDVVFAEMEQSDRQRERAGRGDRQVGRRGSEQWPLQTY